MRNNLKNLLGYLLEGETAKSRHLFENGVGESEIIEENVNEAMESEPPPGHMVWIGESGQGIKIEYNKIDGKTSPRGIIYINPGVHIDDELVWEVSNVEVMDRGYGPLLYDIAMELIYLMGDGGLMPDRIDVSPSARAVWQKYYESRKEDVRAKPLPEDMFFGEKMRNRPDYMRYYYSKSDTPMLKDLNSKKLINTSKFKTLDLPAYLD